MIGTCVEITIALCYVALVLNTKRQKVHCAAPCRVVRYARTMTGQ